MNTHKLSAESLRCRLAYMHAFGGEIPKQTSLCALNFRAICGLCVVWPVTLLVALAYLLIVHGFFFTLGLKLVSEEGRRDVRVEDIKILSGFAVPILWIIPAFFIYGFCLWGIGHFVSGDINAWLETSGIIEGWVQSVTAVLGMGIGGLLIFKFGGEYIVAPLFIAIWGSRPFTAARNLLKGFKERTCATVEIS